MDFLKWIKSLDEALFELMSWLVFWPVTLGRTLAGPLAMMRYADAQLARPEDEQYDEALSPPVFLVLTLIVAHVAALALGQPDELIARQAGVAGMVDNDAAAVAVRLVLYASFPLVFAVLLLLTKQRTLRRASLKLPFYAQCYPAAAFAAALGLVVQLGQLRVVPGGMTGLGMLACVVWLGTVEALWFRREHGRGWPTATMLAVAGMLMGIAITVSAAHLLLTS